MHKILIPLYNRPSSRCLKFKKKNYTKKGKSNTWIKFSPFLIEEQEHPSFDQSDEPLPVLEDQPKKADRKHV